MDSPRSTVWEYTIVHTDRLATPSGPQLSPMWRRKYADGSTDWDQINKLGLDGWEMVSAFPVEAGGTLQYVAFVFKRPRREPGPEPALPSLAAPEAAAPVADEDPKGPDDGGAPADH